MTDDREEQPPVDVPVGRVCYGHVRVVELAERVDGPVEFGGMGFGRLEVEPRPKDEPRRKDVITRANAARLTATGTRQSATRGPVGCSMGSAVPSRLAPGDLGLAAGLNPASGSFRDARLPERFVSRFRRQVIDPPGVVLDTINPRRPHRHHDVDSRPP